jgi:outer membrane protein OmpA-like peptidoglycan-associated protein
MKRTKALCLAAVAAIALAACQQSGVGNRTLAGAGLGALGGGAIGVLFGDDANDRRNNALIGAGLGALTGGSIGYYMDQQEQQLRQNLAGSGVQVTRQGDAINLNLPGNVTFATDSATIQPQFFPALNSIANTLQQYPQTVIDIAGHTDSTGSQAYNQQLSERRANAVKQYLVGQGVMPNRILAAGFGENRPVATNQTAQGRQANRRVDIQIRPFQPNSPGM